MRPSLIGHRGEPETWPENSYQGFEAVLRAGACYIETDVQLTADGVAVLSHDPTLTKITGLDQAVADTDYQVIRKLSAGYPERFGEKYRDFSITRLDEFAALVKQWPQARAFVEIKHGSLKAFGIATVVDTVLATLGEVLGQVIIISFEYEALVYTREVSELPIGWALPAWSGENRSRAQELLPEYLFCNIKRLPQVPETLWKGPWKWVIYTINDASEAIELHKRGVHMIETNVIGKLSADLRLGETAGD
ncbi:MAG: glycerophosphodiester phosphodiesterase family protein [Gammaproteobacteria bacterium]